MTRLVITPLAAADMEEIADSIAAESPRAAVRLIERFREVAGVLRDRPKIGPARNEIADGMRIFPVGNYLILYRVLDDGAEIVRIVHGARRLEDLF
jgi:toxin ParE1/3/4